jgi:predicted phosphodiesterase
LPESQSEDWSPVELDAERVFVISDVHVPFHVVSVVEAALKFGESIKPEVVLLNGDGADFYSISRHQKDPRKRNFKRELDAIRQFLQHVRERFPDARLIYKYGNHEERWEHWLWNHAPEICDLEEVQLNSILKLDSIGWEYVDNQRPIMAGHLPIFHGHELPRGMSSPVNQARGAFLRMLDTVLVGHGHRSSSHTEPNWQHTETTCWSTGCLCELSPAYARINKWNHGFAWVEVASDKSFSVHNQRVSKSLAVRPA